MKAATRLQLNALALEAGASWTLVRENRHLVIDFTASGRIVRRVLAATPSDSRALATVAADLKRALRRWVKWKNFFHFSFGTICSEIRNDFKMPIIGISRFANLARRRANH